MAIIIVVIACDPFLKALHTTISVSTPISVKYYSDYYKGLILENKFQIKFLSINHNKQLSEKFIYSYYKVNCVRRGTDILSDNTNRG
jgi:hypothetical protein